MPRTHRYFMCYRCGATNPNHLTFGVGLGSPRYYCLHHVPVWVQIKAWVRERFGRG